MSAVYKPRRGGQLVQCRRKSSQSCISTATCFLASALWPNIGTPSLSFPKPDHTQSSQKNNLFLPDAKWFSKVSKPGVGRWFSWKGTCYASVGLNLDPQHTSKSNMSGCTCNPRTKEVEAHPPVTLVEVASSRFRGSHPA